MLWADLIAFKIARNLTKMMILFWKFQRSGSKLGMWRVRRTKYCGILYNLLKELYLKKRRCEQIKSCFCFPFWEMKPYQTLLLWVTSLHSFWTRGLRNTVKSTSNLSFYCAPRTVNHQGLVFFFAIPHHPNLKMWLSVKCLDRLQCVQNSRRNAQFFVHRL